MSRLVLATVRRGLKEVGYSGGARVGIMVSDFMG